MRVVLEVCNVGYTEKGISLIDKEKNYYHWTTKTKQSPLMYSSRNEWFKVKANVFVLNDGRKILKNVRIVK